MSVAWLDHRAIEGHAFRGDWRATAGTRDIVEPATGKTLGTTAIASTADIRAACSDARTAQTGWAQGSYERRAEVLRAAAQVMSEARAEIATWIVRESGSVQAKADYEVAVTIKALWEAAAMSSQAAGQVLPSELGRLSIARRKPIGVVGVISPFNFPLYLAMRAVAPALAVGNAVVLKPDPRTAVCGGFVIARVFEQAGLPEGVLSVLPGDGDAGAALCADPDVGMIQFTGSTSAGRKVGALAGEHLKKVSLELGGKNSLIILEDADIELALANTSWGAYLHQGQICMAAGRVLVQQSIANEFAERLAQRASALPVGDPSSGQVALGPLIAQNQVDHAVRIVNASVKDGARLLAGGGADGLFFKPTVLADVKSGMAAYSEEIFAPVAVLTPFDTDDDAVRIANDTDFGLSAGILTNSIARALSIGERLRVGLLHINDQTVVEDAVNPFGGVGASGNGTAIGGPANWEEFTHWQWMTIKGTPPAYPF